MLQMQGKRLTFDVRHMVDLSNSSLPNDVAHRVLARAIEIDSERFGAMSMSRLEEVAREVGVSREAIDAALREIRAEQATEALDPPSVLARIRRLLTRPIGSRADARRGWEWAGRNMIAYAIGAGAFILSANVGWGIAGPEWGTVSQSVGAILGLAVAYRLRARILIVLFSGVLIADVVGYALARDFTWPAAVGGSRGATLMTAILGVALGAYFGRRRSREQPEGTSPARETVNETKSSPRPGWRSWLELRTA